MSQKIRVRNWPWWPSGLRHHIANSSSDHALGPRFEPWGFCVGIRYLRSGLAPFNGIPYGPSVVRVKLMEYLLLQMGYLLNSRVAIGL